jgi:hypothetical protein
MKSAWSSTFLFFSTVRQQASVVVTQRFGNIANKGKDSEGCKNTHGWR